MNRGKYEIFKATLPEDYDIDECLYNKVDELQKPEDKKTKEIEDLNRATETW